VILTITPDGVRRPMATAIVTLLLGLAHELLKKDRLVRDGNWKDRINIKTTGLTGAGFLAAVGLGNIGRRCSECSNLLRWSIWPATRLSNRATSPIWGVELVDLENADAAASDFVSLHTPLTPDTVKLIGARELSWMKPTAYLINASRGPVVDQAALYKALQEEDDSRCGS